MKKQWSVVSFQPGAGANSFGTLHWGRNFLFARLPIITLLWRTLFYEEASGRGANERRVKKGTNILR
jgi:hypothetical protein